MVHPEDSSSSAMAKGAANEGLTSGTSVARGRLQSTQPSALTWTEKYRPKVPGDIIGNQSLVCITIIFHHNLSW